MDQDTADLIAQLCTHAGMIMEDVAETALTVGSARGAERSRRLDQLQRAAHRIGALIDAARALDP